MEDTKDIFTNLNISVPEIVYSYDNEKQKEIEA